MDARFKPGAQWSLLLVGAIATALLVRAVALGFLHSPADEMAEQLAATLSLITETATVEPAMLTSAPTETAQVFWPSGKIVFTCTRGGYNHICTVNADGSDLAQLTQGAYNNYYANVTRAENLILFASNRSGTFRLYRMNWDGTNQAIIPTELDEVAAPDLSPDGEWLVFTGSRAGDTSLWLARPDGSDLHLLFGPASTDIDPSWSPRGDLIAFASNVNGSIELFTIQPDGSGLNQVTRAVEAIGGRSAWSADGTFLTYYAGPKGDRDIYRVDIASGQSIRLTDGGNNAGPCFSPDGQWIIFTSTRDGDNELFIMRADGSDLRQITFNDEDDWQPRWGP